MVDPFQKKTMPSIQIKQYPPLHHHKNKTNLIPSLPKVLGVIQAGQQSEIDGSVQLDLLDEDSAAFGLQVEEIIFLSYG